MDKDEDGEVSRLRKELLDTRELASLATKAAISALAGLDQTLKALRPEVARHLSLSERDQRLDSAEDHVEMGLRLLREAANGSTDGAR